MIHRDLGAYPVLQGKTGNILTMEIDADGTYKAGGDINSGGTPKIALSPGGGIALDGNYGTSGQILVSNGAGQAMSWADQAAATK